MVLQGIAFVLILASEALRGVDWRRWLVQRSATPEPLERRDRGGRRA